ncbi:hypothetical protein OEIGOIKO_06423 [Streptomyces chrestomyceticus JCM 4735]|uniref:Uncharacterized protein n=1 Tax=Streptomyces chrestomyceticus JCM 4735 TaxID=1306181 RepID=A0A7U9L048_9ACTN|nr:hypothetical protein OEIGOIKO_06423 [Streptomyces chrestomyceticus JCM 4735]
MPTEQLSQHPAPTGDLPASDRAARRAVTVFPSW